MERVGVIRDNRTLREAAKRMDEEALGVLAVRHEGSIAGLLTDRDLMRSVIAHGVDADRVRVGEVQVAEDSVLFGSMDVVDASTLMRSRGLRRAIVVNAEGVVLGLVNCEQLEGACRSKPGASEDEGGKFLGFGTSGR